MAVVLSPQGLYELNDDLPRLEGAVLLHGLVGFVDAGQAVQRGTQHLVDSLERRTLARFDVDQLLDYRSRRPQLTFRGDHYADYETPQLELVELKDLDGTPFVLLRGREPDVSWERFAAAVEELVSHLGIGLSVELHAFPVSVPHSRPVSFTTHGSRRDLLDVVPSWNPTTVVPASAGALLEMRLTQAGHDTFGLGVHVPHYLAEGDYPAATAALLDTAGTATGLRLPTEELHNLADEARQQIDAQVAESDEVAEIVHGLERQYDAWRDSVDGTSLQEDVADGIPSAEELGATFERFLAEHDKRGGEGGLGG